MQVNFPNSWQRIPLGKAFKTITGNTPSKKETSNYGHDIPFIKPPNICNRPISDFQEMLSKKGAVNGRIAPKDSILITCIGNLGRVGITTKNVGFNQQINAILPNYELAHPKFIYFQAQWQHFKRQLESYSSATTVTIVNKGNFDKIQILLPPLPEQHRIVAKLEELFSELDNGIANLKKAQAQLKVYRQAVLKAAFEGKLTEQWRERQFRIPSVQELIAKINIPEKPNRYSSRSKEVVKGDFAIAVGNPNTATPPNWAWVSLVKIAKLESGHTPSRRHPEYWDGDIPWVGIQDAKAHHGMTIFSTKQTTNELGLANSAARLLPENTVCLSRTASLGYAIKLGVPMATSQDFVNWICTEAIDPDWLKFLFIAERQSLLRFGKGSVHKTIYFPEVLSLHVLLPPIEEQHQIVQEIESRLSVCDHLEQEIDKALRQSEALRQSILKKAFEGRLVPQDPGDEPAGELLKRIKHFIRKSN